MKLAKLILASSLVASFALADGAFIGIQGGYDSSSYDVVDGWADADFDRAGHFVIGVKGGFDYGSSRAYAGYNYKTKDTIYESTDGKVEVGAHQFIIGYDWTPSVSESLKFSVGPYIGYSRLNITASGEDQNGAWSEKENQNGFVIGGKVGLIFDFGMGEFEAGVKADYSKHAGSEDSVDIDAGTVGGFIGYNFKF